MTQSAAGTLSYELHDKEDSHKCGDDSHAPRPPEGADWVEGSQGHRHSPFRLPPTKTTSNPTRRDRTGPPLEVDGIDKLDIEFEDLFV